MPASCFRGERESLAAWQGQRDGWVLSTGSSGRSSCGETLTAERNGRAVAETQDPCNDPKQVEKGSWVSCAPDSSLKIAGGPGSEAPLWAGAEAGARGCWITEFQSSEASHAGSAPSPSRAGLPLSCRLARSLRTGPGPGPLPGEGTVPCLLVI